MFQKVHRSWWPILCIGTALIVSIIVIMGTTSRTLQSYHGLYHAAYINQIYNGIVPPTNPISLGTPANSYWIWHLVLSVVMRIFSLAPLQATLLSNCVGIALFSVGMWMVLSRYQRSNLAICTLFCSSFFLVAIPWLTGLTIGRSTVITLGLLGKFYTVNGFSLATGISMLLVGVTLRWGTAAPANNKTQSYILGVACTLLTLCISLIHPTTGTAMFLFGVSGMLVSAYKRKTNWYLFIPFIGIILGFLLSFPYALELQQHLAQQTRLATPQAIATYLLKAYKTGLAGSALVCIWAILRLKKLDINGKILLCTCIGLCLASLLLRLPGGNQYKYLLLLSPLTTMLLCTLCTKRIFAGKRLHTVALCILTISSLVILGSNLLLIRSTLFKNDWHQKNPYIFVDHRIQLNPAYIGNRHKQAAYQWIIDNTKPTDYILAKPTHLNELEISALTMRRTVAAFHRNHVSPTNIPYHTTLFHAADALIKDMQTLQFTKGEMQQLFALPAPWPDSLYIFVEHNLQSESVIQQYIEENQIPIELHFYNNEFAIYSISTSL